ncbi:glycerophosphodiester phosphodiesterase family protein [Agilicoccus flavus]|uniref:glycerophosphodiester phosphodiesterase family protein n=1 Tax=Agilicoccus flavus TaxID=2775968 RepID=UPI001CF61B31|nr:glycerophosphodiester phosphodiesterase family protein [Agilicoccus flavus]
MGYADSPGPIALAHRGGAGLGPENTLLTFSRSVGLGFRHLETDVRVTADGDLVCLHDATLERLTGTGGAGGTVRRLTSAQLRRVRVGGEPVPALAEALDAFPHTNFSVDLKEAAAIGPLVALLRRPGVARRVCVAGAWDGWLSQVRAEVPEVSTSLGWRSLVALIASSRTGARRPPRRLARAPFAHVPVKLGAVPIFVERVVDLAHELGIRVVTWTVDDAATMHALLDAGADAVITDRPDVLREVLVARNQWQPPTLARAPGMRRGPVRDLVVAGGPPAAPRSAPHRAPW